MGANSAELTSQCSSKFGWFSSLSTLSPIAYCSVTSGGPQPTLSVYCYMYWCPTDEQENLRYGG